MGAPRAGGALDLGAFLELSQNAFSSVLDAILEAKTLLIDPTLAGPLGMMTDLASLRQRGVDKMYWMEEADERGPVARIQAPTQHLLYICRAESRWMKTLAAHYAADVSSSESGVARYSYAVALVPHRTEPCLQFLREKALLPHVRVLDLGLEFTVMGPDVLSLEDPYAWPRLFQHGDHTPLFHAAQALMTLQRMVGVFPRIVGKGDLANRLSDLLVRQRREHQATHQDAGALDHAAPNVDALIVLDRTVDLASPLCTQLTYEGLVDDVLHIRHGFLEVDAAWTGGTSASGGRRKVRLDGSEDALFSSICDDNFAVVGEKLHLVAKRLSHDYEGRHQATTVQELRAFVNRLGSLQSEHASLRLHTCITEHLLQQTHAERFHRVLEIQQNLIAGLQLAKQWQAIEALMDLGAPALTVLRLACLASYVQGGMAAAPLETFRTAFVQMYGYAYVPALMALESMHILCAASPEGKAPKHSQWSRIVKPLRLMDDDVDERAQRDISYVYSGYAPLSIRLVQTICQHEAVLRAAPAERPRAPRIAGWHGVDEAVLSWPGATFDFMQVDQAAPPPDDVERTTVVFFVGGVTYAEIAALRLMSRQQRTRRFLIATTGMISGDGLLVALSPETLPQLD